MGRCTYVIAALASAGTPATLAAVSAAEQPNQVDESMKAKLGHAQKVLEGLTRED